MKLEVVAVDVSASSSCSQAASSSAPRHSQIVECGTACTLIDQFRACGFVDPIADLKLVVGVILARWMLSSLSARTKVLPSPPSRHLLGITSEAGLVFRTLTLRRADYVHRSFVQFFRLVPYSS